MTIKKCDRCGKMIDPVSPTANSMADFCTVWPKIYITVRRNPLPFYDDETFDLCHDCSVAVLNFIESSKKED